MENINGLVQDALKTANYILNSLTPYDEWVIVNLCKVTNNPAFTYPTYPEIPTIFGYSFDKVPEFFIKEGVIEAKTFDKWYSGLTIVPYYGSQKHDGLPIYDGITKIARNKEYINKSNRVGYYEKWKRDYVDDGPGGVEHYSALINVKKLREFVRWYGNQSPKVDIKNGHLYYLKFVLPFNGDEKIKAVKLLVDNINSIVSYKEFYEIREGTNYDKDSIKQKSRIHNSLESMFKTIKSELKKSELKNYLIMVQQDGFGMFINYIKPEKPSKGEEATQK